jgi:ribosome biogenesis GTPase
MTGVVIKSTGSWMQVSENETGKVLDCRIKGKLRIKEGMLTTNPVAVGDHVSFNLEEDGNGVIKDVLTRKNYIIRKSVNLSRQAHIIAANIDQALLFFTMKQPEIPLGFIDRFLITAEAYHIPVIILFNKRDIYNDEELKIAKALMHEYERIGYKCMMHSTILDSAEEIKKLLKDKVTLLSGHSGIGKSSLINSVQSGLELKTNDISSYHEKGQHTTTFAEMFPLDFGGWIIDTPGIKGFGLVDMEKSELCHYFPEMRELMHACKFNNCKHINEPGCAIKKAVEEGEIWENRYINYLSVYEEDEDETYRGKGY